MHRITVCIDRSFILYDNHVFKGDSQKILILVMDKVHMLEAVHKSDTYCLLFPF